MTVMRFVTIMLLLVLLVCVHLSSYDTATSDLPDGVVAHWRFDEEGFTRSWKLVADDVGELVEALKVPKGSTFVGRIESVVIEGHSERGGN